MNYNKLAAINELSRDEIAQVLGGKFLGHTSNTQDTSTTRNDTSHDVHSDIDFGIFKLSS